MSELNFLAYILFRFVAIIIPTLGGYVFQNNFLLLFIAVLYLGILGGLKKYIKKYHI